MQSEVASLVDNIRQSVIAIVVELNQAVSGRVAYLVA
jgi:hypothetical protein